MQNRFQQLPCFFDFKKLFLLLANLFCLHVYSQKTLILTEQTNRADLGYYCGFFLDSTNSMSTKEVQKALLNNKFKFYNTYAKSFGTTASTVWCYFSLLNKTESDFYLELEKTRLDTIEIFHMEFDSSFVSEYTGGNKYPFSTRKFQVNNFIYPLKHKSFTTQFYLLRMRGNYIMEFPLKIYSESKLVESKHLYDIFDGIYIGLILLIIFFNLFVYYTIKENVHFYYSIYVFFEGAMVLYYKGFAYEFIFPDSPQLNSYLTILPTFVTLSAVIFLFSFLDSKRTTPFLYKLFYLFMILASLGMIMNFVGYDGEGQMLVEFVSAVTSVTIFFAGITSYRRGIKHAKLFVIAWSIFLFGVVIYVLKDFGILPYNDITCNSIQIGSAFEIILITVALAQKMNDFKQEKENLQIQSINTMMEKEKLILEQNRILEERNAEKEVMLKEIHHRVKNNLAVVSGILQVQSAYCSDNLLKQVLNDCTNRIRSMGLVHESLYRYENFSGIDFNQYLQNLTHEIKNSYPDNAQKIELRLNIDNIILELTTAIPCGLLVTEVLTNTYKHAFKGRTEGIIEINFHRNAHQYELSIRDNGVGFDAGIHQNSNGLGLSLIKAFSSQLGGNYSFTGENGSVFKITFPVKH